MVTEGSSAYNFEMFEPQKQRTQPQFKVVQNKKMERVRTRNFILKVATYVSVFFVGVISVLFNQIAITEITNEVSNKNAELNTLQNEYRMLEAQLESSVALTNIEETVTRQLGLTKLDSSQITYLSLSEEDTYTIPEEKQGGLWARIKQVVEYISAQ